MTTQVKADFMLLLVTIFWGVSYWLVDISLAESDPFTLNAFRFIIAFLVAFIFAYNKLNNVNKITIKYSALLGSVLLLVYVGATFGVKYTSLSNAGFLCSLTVIFTPILALIVLKHVPDKKLILTVIMCLIGIALLTLNEELKPALGDILCIMCAFTYAVHLLITEYALKKDEINAFQLGVFQLGFTGLFNFLLSIFLETPEFPDDPKTWTAVLFLAIFCTGFSFIVQTLAQQYTSASHVGVIFSLEPVFAGIVAYFFAGEVLTAKAYVGGIILIASIFILEADFKKLTLSIRKP